MAGKSIVEESNPSSSRVLCRGPWSGALLHAGGFSTRAVSQLLDMAWVADGLLQTNRLITDASLRQSILSLCGLRSGFVAC